MTETVAGSRLDASAWEGLEDMRDALQAFLARHCADENDIEDVIQETFLRAARYRRAHCVQSLRPWAMRIALNVLADVKRRAGRMQGPDPDEEGFDPPAPPPTLQEDGGYRVGALWLDGESARELLLRALGGLREQDRGLLDSYYGGELETLVTAHECGIPRPLVKVRLYRARQRLLGALRLRLKEPSWTLRAS